MEESRVSVNKARGTAFETLIVNFLKMWQPDAERRAMQGQLDKGDIYIPGEKRFVIECKNTKELKLAQWVEEAKVEADNAKVPYGVVVHKRRLSGNPAEMYVTMPLYAFVGLVYGEPIGA
jgi:hypothetical protein